MGPIRHANSGITPRSCPEDPDDDTDTRDPSIASLYRRERGNLLRYAEHMLHGLDAADDVVQQAFTKALAAAEHGSDVTRPYLFKAVRNECSKARSRARRFLTFNPTQLDSYTGTAPPARSEYEEAVDDLLYPLQSLLPAREFAVLRLLVMGYTTKAIAEDLKISESTVRSHLSRARILLKRERERERERKKKQQKQNADCRMQIAD